jgi:isopenicillin N synthase-like dioxygenase
MAQHTIPIVDLNDYINGDANSKSIFINALGKAYEEFGFVSVKNHGIPDAVVNEYYKSVEAFFALPTDEKLKYEIKELAGQRGYTSFGREHAKGSTAPDLKEFWQMGQIVEDNDPIKSQYPDNVNVGEIEHFNELGISLYKAFEKTGTIMLQAIANYLHIDENYFDKHVHNGNSILRAIHYPPISAEPASSIRAEQHEDINLITLLVGASAEGLQLLDKKNEWLPITAPEGCIIVNVGDMLQRLTNNKLSSTTHRVVNPKRELWHTHRYSIPFFMHPRSEMDLTCLDSCVTAENPLAYEPITAGDYLTERLIEIGLLKK